MSAILALGSQKQDKVFKSSSNTYQVWDQHEILSKKVKLNFKKRSKSKTIAPSYRQKAHGTEFHSSFWKGGGVIWKSVILLSLQTRRHLLGEQVGPREEGDLSDLGMALAPSAVTRTEISKPYAPRIWSCREGHPAGALVHHYPIATAAPGYT